MTTPRPDQRHLPGGGGAVGSRSGSGDLAAGLGYPGVPPAVVNCKSAQILQQNAQSGQPVFITFPAPGRLWTVILSYTITSGAAFTGSARTFALVQTVLSVTTLAVCNIGVARAGQHAEGQSEPSIPGLPVTQGESLQLNVNGGVTVPSLSQQASVLVLYSIP